VFQQAADTVFVVDNQDAGGTALGSGAGRGGVFGKHDTDGSSAGGMPREFAGECA
jgi:hypothetical protein